jgi:hypothetical protein
VLHSGASPHLPSNSAAPLLSSRRTPSSPFTPLRRGGGNWSRRPAKDLILPALDGKKQRGTISLCVVCLCFFLAVG